MRLPTSLAALAAVNPSLSFRMDNCTGKLPSWTIDNLKASYVNENATATWSVANLLTGKSEALACRLYAMSHCRIEGVPSDPNFHMYLQTGLDVVWITINETLSCNNATS